MVTYVKWLAAKKRLSTVHKEHQYYTTKKTGGFNQTGWV
jgi:predicted transcriptional regulator